MNRRTFLQLLTGAAAALALDPGILVPAEASAPAVTPFAIADPAWLIELRAYQEFMRLWERGRGPLWLQAKREGRRIPYLSAAARS